MYKYFEIYNGLQKIHFYLFKNFFFSDIESVSSREQLNSLDYESKIKFIENSFLFV